MKFIVPRFVLVISLLAAPRVMGQSAQTNHFQQTNIVTGDTTATAKAMDPVLINPWGIAFFPGSPFWIADNNSGFSTAYDANGVQSFKITVAPPPGSSAFATPTGIVANNVNGGFQVNGSTPLFIFSTEDGTISAWATGSSSMIAVDNSGKAIYKGLAAGTISQNVPVLYAPNFLSGKIEVFGQTYVKVTPPGSFMDMGMPAIPSDYAPFGVHTICDHSGANCKVYVTWAKRDNANNPVSAPGAGYVSVFDENGNFVSRFASQGTLNAPWGVTLAPVGFGGFANALLVGNFGDGTINVFDAASGAFQDQLRDTKGAVIANASLWDMVFGAGGTGDPNTLYFTAGLANEKHGIFSALAFATPTNGPDFTLSNTAMNGTLTPTQAATFSISANAQNGFNGSVTFSCSGAPAGVTCSVNPATPAMMNGVATTTLTLKETVGRYMVGIGEIGAPNIPFVGPFVGPVMWALVWPLFSTMALLSVVYWTSLKRRSGPSRLALICLAGLALSLVALAGCGSKAPMGQGAPPRGPANVMVTATSGSTSHTTSISFTVN
jgi:uncharacterized protein (TIGR03118 family)